MANGNGAQTDFAKRLGFVEVELGDLKAAVSGLAAQGNAILDQLQQAARDRADIQERLNRPVPGTNWGALGTVAGLLASFVVLNTGPMQRDIDHIREDNVVQKETVRGLSQQIAANTRYLQEVSIEMSELRRNALDVQAREISDAEKRGVLQGEQELLQRQMSDIDAFGARKWIGEKR